MYVKVDEAGARLYSLNQLKADNPNTSFPEAPTVELLASYDVHPVTIAPMPGYNELSQYVQPGEIVEISGEWIQTWDVLDLPQDVASANVRAQRNAEISACDWTQLSDAPVDKAAWAAYRADLRNIPEQAGFPHDVLWPTKPE